jgi:hypothetical protein
MSRNLFVGIWSLDSCVARSAAGAEGLPFGEMPLGQLIYTSTGHMSALLSRRQRSPFVSEDRRQASDEELRASFEGFDAYCGTFDVESDASRIIHHVKLSNWPNAIGTDYVRYFELKRDTLVLTTPPTLARGTEWVLTLHWHRLV